MVEEEEGNSTNCDSEDNISAVGMTDQLAGGNDHDGPTIPPMQGIAAKLVFQCTIGDSGRLHTPNIVPKTQFENGKDGFLLVRLQSQIREQRKQQKQMEALKAA